MEAARHVADAGKVCPALQIIDDRATDVDEWARTASMWELLPSNKPKSETRLSVCVANPATLS